MNFFQIFTPNLYTFFTSKAAQAMFANMAAQQTQNYKMVKTIPSKRRQSDKSRSQRCCDCRSRFYRNEEKLQWS